MKEIYVDGSYLKQNPSWGQEDSIWKATQVLELIRKHGLAPSTVGEIGCGAGAILECLHNHMDDNVEFRGYEISPQAIEFCETRAKERLSYELKDVLEDDKAHFDLLLVLDVVEHVENYLEFLRRVREKGDLKVFIIPLELNVLSILRKIPIQRRKALGHISHFSKLTALEALRESQYEIIDSHYIETAFVSEKPSTMAFLKKFLLRLPVYLHQDWGVRLMGGHALIVLAR